MSHKHLTCTELHQTFTVSSDSKKGGRRHVIATSEIPAYNEPQETKVTEPFNGQVQAYAHVSPQGTPAVAIADSRNELGYVETSDESSTEQSVSTKAVTGSLLKGFNFDDLSEVVCSVITEYNYKEAKTVHSLEDTRTYYDGYNIK